MRIQRRLLVLCLGQLLACTSAPPKKDPHLSIDLTRREGNTPSLAAALGQLDVPAVAERCGPAVVVILGNNKQGSGVILAGTQLVATNAHVVEGQSSLEIKLRDGRSFKGTLELADEKADLALVRLPVGTYPTVELGDSDALRAGEGVVAIGAPLGLEQTVSSGEIAALRQAEGERFIQISVPISRGSSGGGVFDRNSRLIGITTFSATAGQNLNFAMPSNRLKELLLKVKTAPR